VTQLTHLALAPSAPGGSRGSQLNQGHQASPSPSNDSDSNIPYIHNPPDTTNYYYFADTGKDIPVQRNYIDSNRNRVVETYPDVDRFHAYRAKIIRRRNYVLERSYTALANFNNRKMTADEWNVQHTQFIQVLEDCKL